MSKADDDVVNLKAQLAKRDQQLDQIIALLGGRTAEQESEDARVLRMAAELKGQTRPPPRERLIPCQSEASNATFKLRVVESRGFPEGRIVDLVDYKHPVGIDVHQRDGGLVPDGMQMRRPDNGYPLPTYKQWLWDNFWKADLVAYNGKPYSKRYAADPSVDVPWVQALPKAS